VFVAQGYHAAAMDDIADRTGVSKPVLYQHFPGKLDLYLALLEEQTDAMVAAVREALDSTSDNKQRVAATIEAYFRFVDEDGEAFRLVFASDLTIRPEVRERVEGTTRAGGGRCSGVCADGAGLPAEQARLLAVGLVGMAQVAARFWLAEQGSIPRDAASRLLASLSWRGIGGFPRTGEAH
jgi:AcrR family transcriptional regulator